MSKFLTLKFSRTDKFLSPVFYASALSDTDYEKLSMYFTKINDLESHNNPVYISDGEHYANVTFCKSRLLKGLTKNATYKIEYSCKSVKSDNKRYVNFNAKSVKLVCLPPVDDSEEVELD